ncbi:hypothetical protein A5685_24820 [Mycobacterium colombiense]|uniref:DUF732 domain-containing protein n=1 Tax=Mycobacterium colombiense TaxID=339268 RepID=A0A1A2SC96_9MYCO|nr:DUF732 domain-containing protein [Mycobacterium colombiense]OBH61645.1 hypothetical protein A5685_24820 [Mycobacterium colombiense]
MFTATTRCTGVTSHAGVLVATLVLLSGAAILRGGAATADSNEDDQFLALLAQEGIPALEGVPSLVDVAHKVCRALDAGIPADRVLDAMVEYAGSNDPPERFYAPGRLARTEARFITASVGAYCPYDRSKITFLVTDAASRQNDPAHPMADNIRNAVNSRFVGERLDFDVHRAVLASSTGAVPGGEVTQPNPPQLPAPPPPLAHQAPPQPIAVPPRPQRVPPPPQQSPPPPRVAPQPGAAPGDGGGGITGGDLPAAPPPAPPVAPPPPAPPAAPSPPEPPSPQPAPPMAPGFVKLAP